MYVAQGAPLFFATRSLPAEKEFGKTVRLCCTLVHWVEKLSVHRNAANVIE